MAFPEKNFRRGTSHFDFWNVLSHLTRSSKFDENPLAFIFNSLIVKGQWDFRILTIRALPFPYGTSMDNANLAYRHAKFHP